MKLAFSGWRVIGVPLLGLLLGCRGGQSSLDAAGEGHVEASTAVDREWAEWPVPDDSPPASTYSVSGEVVKDLKTGLQWQRSAYQSELHQQAAIEYCRTVKTADTSGWRLPTLIELLSIVNYGKANPAIDSVAFPDTQAAPFWSATVISRLPNGQPLGGWLVNFASGECFGAQATNPLRVRCVR